MNEDTLFPMAEFAAAPEVSLRGVSDTCDAGTVAETMLAAEAAKRGWTVFVPFGHAQKTDIVLTRGRDPAIRIQVKRATWQRKGSGSYKFMIGAGRPSCAANPNDYGLRYRRYESGDFDFLAAFIPDYEIFAFYRLSDIVGKSSHHWRPDPGHPRDNWDIMEVQ